MKLFIFFMMVKIFRKRYIVEKVMSNMPSLNEIYICQHDSDRKQSKKKGVQGVSNPPF